MRTSLHFDIVIIGSGAGGGTVAAELAPLCQLGMRIALLEWGGEFRPEDNNGQELSMAEKYYVDYGGVQNKSMDVTFAFARALGGSTTVYTGTSLTAPDRVFEKWAVPGITASDMRPRYEKYILQNNVHLLPDEEINDNNRLFARGCSELGWKYRQFPVNVKNCQGKGICNLGCPGLSKQGTNVVQIPRARSLGVEVFPFTRALKIKGKFLEVEVVAPRFGLSGGPLKPGHYVFTAKKIVLAAGAVNTPALLMRSFGRNFLPAIGRYFTCHPALILVGEHDRQISNSTGHPKSYYCDEFTEEKNFLLESCMYFPFVLSKGLTGFGPGPDDLMSSFSRLQMILSLVMDKAHHHNRIALDLKGEPVIHYQLDDEIISSFVESIRASVRIFFRAGARRVHAPAMEEFFIEREDENKIDELIQKKHFKTGKISVSAAHLMGGCRMGTDDKSSVTNEWGKVHGHDHLYVADASLFPAASEANPYLTIMALADRVAEGIKREST